MRYKNLIVFNLLSVFLLLLILIGCNEEKPNSMGLSTGVNNVMSSDPSRRDSVFFNCRDSLNDRILFFDGKYFLWIKRRKMGADSVLAVYYGKYTTKKSIILFEPPDSMVMKNSVFCFCADGINSNPKFHLISEDNNDELSDKNYRRLFIGEKPQLNEIQVAVTDTAMRLNGVLKFSDGNEYQLMKGM